MSASYPAFFGCSESETIKDTIEYNFDWWLKANKSELIRYLEIIETTEFSLYVAFPDKSYLRLV